MQTEEEVVKSRAVTCMECNGTIQARMTIQPSSLDSEIHARMSLMISEKFKKEKKSVPLFYLFIFQFLNEFLS